MLLCYMYNEACFSFYVLPISSNSVASELINPKERMNE